MKRKLWGPGARRSALKLRVLRDAAELRHRLWMRVLGWWEDSEELWRDALSTWPFCMRPRRLKRKPAPGQRRRDVTRYSTSPPAPPPPPRADDRTPRQLLPPAWRTAWPRTWAPSPSADTPGCGTLTGPGLNVRPAGSRCVGGCSDTGSQMRCTQMGPLPWAMCPAWQDIEREIHSAVEKTPLPSTVPRRDRFLVRSDDEKTCLLSSVCVYSIYVLWFICYLLCVCVHSYFVVLILCLSFLCLCISVVCLSSICVHQQPILEEKLDAPLDGKQLCSKDTQLWGGAVEGRLCSTTNWEVDLSSICPWLSLLSLCKQWPYVWNLWRALSICRKSPLQ